MAAIDLFLVAGQSNAEGRGQTVLSPAVTNGSLMYSAGTVQVLADPVGGAATGSAWPAFANAYGRCAITEAAVGGSKLIAYPGGGSNWSPTGTLFAAAVAQAEAATTALEAQGWTVNLRGVLWSQGESEALEYEPVDLTAEYQAALEAIFARFRTELGAGIQMWVARTGRLTSGDTANWQKVRDAQDAACAATDGLHMAYTGTLDFPDLGWMKVDGIHYTQAGLNAMGTAMGEHVRGDLAAESLIVDVNGDPVVAYQRVDGEAVPMTDYGRDGA